MHTRTDHVAVASALALLLVAGCASSDQAETHVGGGHVHYRPAMVDIADVMQVKLVHTQAIVEGLALGDMRQVAMNAESLHGLSSRASWMVHDSVTYVAMSEKFRETVAALQQHAQTDDADAAMAAYVAVTRSCLDCHTYLREERQFKDLPGRRSMVLDQLDANVW